VSTWIEAALNGPWGRDRQPGIPVTVDEVVADGLACADEGAAIIHVHAYDPETGRQNDDWQTYARIIEGIRAASDALVYPTIPLAGGPDAAAGGDAGARFAAVAELAARGLIEWTVVDPGSAQLSPLDALGRGEAAGFLYQNPVEHVAHGLSLCAAHGLRPGYAIYEPGFTRLGAPLATALGAPQPLYRFMFSDGLSFGFPPEPAFLDAHLALLDREAPGAPWMIAGLDVDVTPLIPHAVARGGHVRAGLEDARFGETRTNAQLTAAARTAIEAAGGTIATPSDVRNPAL